MHTKAGRYILAAGSTLSSALFLGCLFLALRVGESHDPIALFGTVERLCLFSTRLFSGALVFSVAADILKSKRPR